MPQMWCAAAKHNALFAIIILFPGYLLFSPAAFKRKVIIITPKGDHLRAEHDSPMALEQKLSLYFQSSHVALIAEPIHLCMSREVCTVPSCPLTAVTASPGTLSAQLV